MTHLRTTCAALLLLALVGCEQENDDDVSDETCTISGSLSGDLTAALPGPDGIACLSQFSSDDGFDVQFATFTEHPIRVDLSVDGVTRGMLGDAFPAEVRVYDDTTILGASIDCTVDVTEHTLVGPVDFGESWQIRGAGRCTGPLTLEDGGSVTIAPFMFAAEVTWTD